MMLAAGYVPDGPTSRPCSFKANWTSGLSCIRAVALMVGGESGIGIATKTVELYSPSKGGQVLGEIPKDRKRHSLDYLGGKVYLCGGEGGFDVEKTCLVGEGPSSTVTNSGGYSFTYKRFKLRARKMSACRLGNLPISIFGNTLVCWFFLECKLLVI